MLRTYFNFMAYVFTLLFVCTACEPEPISIDPPPSGVAFSAQGLIDGNYVDMSKDVILFTDSEKINDRRTYEGQLLSGCVDQIVSNCSQHLSITFMDSLSGMYNSLGFPIMLEQGVKRVYIGPVLPAASSLLCLESTSSDSILVNGNPLSTEYCIAPPSDEFTSISLHRTPSIINPLNEGLVDTEIMFRMVGSEIEYYFLDFDCQKADSFINLSFRLGGNTSLDLDDFRIVTSAGGFNPNSTLNLSFPFILDLTMIHLTTLDSTFFHFVGFVGCSALDSLRCQFPVSVSEHSTVVESPPGIVLIEYWDESGTSYSSMGTNQSDQSFVINSTEPYEMDGVGNETVISSITFNGTLMSSEGGIIPCENLEMKFGFGYLTD